MEELIKQAFRNHQGIGQHVQEGLYDLFGPNRETILPSLWENMIEPDWQITMRMSLLGPGPPGAQGIDLRNMTPEMRAQIIRQHMDQQGRRPGPGGPGPGGHPPLSPGAHLHLKFT